MMILFAFALILVVLFALPVYAQTDKTEGTGTPEEMKLAEQWWQWFMSISEDRDKHPVFDYYGNVTQANNPVNGVFFIAGNWEGKYYPRYVDVPAGMPIFGPVLNGGYSYYSSPIETIGGFTYPWVDRTDLWNRLQDRTDQDKKDQIAIDARLDGHNITAQAKRITTPLWVIENVHENNVFNSTTLVRDTVVDGYWLYFEDGLPEGKHVLYIHGKSPGYFSKAVYVFNVT